LVDLGPHDCLWPVGRDEFNDHLFCGRSRVGNGPYCATHAASAGAGYGPPKTRPSSRR
jgi:hypothetical protein